MTTLTGFLSTHGLNGSGGASATAGRNDLARLMCGLGYVRGAEIGVWEGNFSKKLCQAIPGLRLLCIDPWTSYAGYHDAKNDWARLEQAYATAKARLGPFQCRILRMTSLDAAADVPDRSLDFVYIDGNHSRRFVLQDLEAWTPKVRVGGIVAGHDYTEDPRKTHIQVKAAVDAFTAKRGIRPVYILAADKSPSFFWTAQ